MGVTRCPLTPQPPSPSLENGEQGENPSLGSQLGVSGDPSPPSSPPRAASLEQKTLQAPRRLVGFQEPLPGPRGGGGGGGGDPTHVFLILSTLGLIDIQ